MKSVRRFSGLAAVLLAFVLATELHGQGTAGHGIPDPISTTELLRYADRLSLSDEQRQALQPFHDEYRERFRTLREGEIDRFVEEMQQHGGRAAIGSQIWDGTSRRRDGILAQIRALDEALFTEIETILTEEQVERMPRVRLVRQRSRMMPIAQMAMTMFQITDLSDLVHEVGMSSTERERIDPFLAQYEQRLTRMMQEIPAIVVSVRKDLNESGEAFRQELRDDPTNREEASQRMMERNHEAQLQTQRHMVAIRRLGRETLFNITPHLSDRSARQLRASFVRSAYGGMIWNPMRSHVEGALEALLDRDDLDSQIHERLSEVASHVWRQNEAIFRDALAEVDERESEITMFVLHRHHARDEAQELERRVRERIHAVEDPVIHELMDLLPDEVSSDLVQRLPRSRRPAGRAAPPAAPMDPKAQAAVEAQRAAMESGVVPVPLSARDVAAYRRHLEADEEQRAAIEELFTQYTTRVEETANPARREMVQFYSPDRGEPEEFVERNARHRGRAINAIERADQAFFDGLAEFFPSRADDIDRMRLSRERQRYTINPMARMWIRSSPRRFEFGAADIDLSSLARGQDIDITASPDADQILLDYERNLTQLLRDRYSRTLEASDFGTISLGWFMLRDQHPEESEALRAAARAAQQEAEERLAAAERAITELNRQKIDELVAALPEQDGAAVLAAYRERAMPQVYRDPGAMEEILSRTLRMDDLNSSQRDSLAELLAEYRAEYGNLTSQMHEVAERQRIEVDERAAGAPPGGAARLREQFEKLRHDRQELNARTILNLEGILNDSQMARLGPMPDPTRPVSPRPWGF